MVVHSHFIVKPNLVLRLGWGFDNIAVWLAQEELTENMSMETTGKFFRYFSQHLINCLVLKSLLCLLSSFIFLPDDRRVLS